MFNIFWGEWLKVWSWVESVGMDRIYYEEDLVVFGDSLNVRKEGVREIEN